MAIIDIREDEEAEINEVRFSDAEFISLKCEDRIYHIKDCNSDIMYEGYVGEIDNLIKALQKVKELRDNNN